MRRFSACPCVASRMGSGLGLSGQPSRAEANGALLLALHSGRATGVARNPGILVRMPRDAAATNFASRVDLETKTCLCRIGLIRPAAAHATCKRARPPCGRAFGCAHVPILIKNVLDCPKTLDAGLAQITAGLAWHHKQYAQEQTPEERERYASAKLAARARRAGLWSDPNPGRHGSGGR